MVVRSCTSAPKGPSCVYELQRHTWKCCVGDPDEVSCPFCYSDFAAEKFFCRVVWRMYVFLSSYAPEGLFSSSGALLFGCPSAFAFCSISVRKWISRETGVSLDLRLKGETQEENEMWNSFSGSKFGFELSNQNVVRKWRMIKNSASIRLSCFLAGRAAWETCSVYSAFMA